MVHVLLFELVYGALPAAVDAGSSFARAGKITMAHCRERIGVVKRSLWRRKITRRQSPEHNFVGRIL